MGVYVRVEHVCQMDVRQLIYHVHQCRTANTHGKKACQCMSSPSLVIRPRLRKTCQDSKLAIVAADYHITCVRMACR